MIGSLLGSLTGSFPAADLLHRLPPGSLLVLGALIVPWLRTRVRIRQGLLLALPLLSAWHLLSMPVGWTQTLPFGGGLFAQDLVILRVDRLSLVWGYIFHIAAFLGVLFALRGDGRPHDGEFARDPERRWSLVATHTAALIYAGAAIGAVFTGDLVTLFVYWEVTAIASVFLVLAPHTYLSKSDQRRQGRRSRRAAMRYLIIQVGSGVILLAGIVMRWADGGSMAFDELGLVDGPTTLIFLAFGIKAAFPLLHNWLEDAYPEASPSGTVFLSAFTTKMAIYTLARGFPGTEELIWIGAAMTAFPIFFAVIENDLRRVLSYSLNNQLGFMVVGVGLGTEMSLNGTAAHAFAHILYKALLFMAMGAVLMRTGTAKGSELGGLYKSMPWTTGFCIVGAASISAFPLTSGFVSKSLILSAAAEQHLTIVWMVLLFASAGVFHHSGIKIPFFAFFAHDSGRRVKEAPLHMLLAMGATAALCLLVGMFPGALYSILPYTMEVYEPYTAFHVVTQLQLLFFSALAFTVLNRWGVYPPELRSTVLDFDWFYRRPLARMTVAGVRLGEGIWQGMVGSANGVWQRAVQRVQRVCGRSGIFAHTWGSGAIALCAVLMLGLYALIFLVLGP